MTIYDDFQRVAQDLIGEFAQGSVSLISTAESGDEWDPTITETTTAVDAVVSGVSAKYRDMEVEGGVIVRGSDLQVDIPAGGVVPDISDHFDIDGVRYDIIKIEAVPAAGTVAYYRSIVRK